MEILLIGNGFDLEHDLPTHYKDFLDFCDKAGRIYTFYDDILLCEYKQKNLDNWEVNTYIKEILLKAFENRKYTKRVNEDGTYDTEVTTSNKALDEMYTCIKHNVWFEYFLNASSNIGENWIDFELEISKVIQALDSARFQVQAGGSVRNVEKYESQMLMNILKCSKGSLQNAYGSSSQIDVFTKYLYTELNMLTRALEIYIAEFVGGIIVSKRSTDIENLNPDHVLSFNYSDTYEKIYGKEKKIKYDYIHGKANINKNVKTSNLVLGIDEYLNDERKDSELEFLVFKKFYQRVYKSTDNDYLNWIDRIRDEYANYIENKNNMLESYRNSHYSVMKHIYLVFAKEKIPKHNLYIFGHSLDITDRDVLRLFICNDNVQTKIFYYRENEEDKRTLGRLIKNLIQIIGQEELIKRTGGLHKTIEFIPQAIS